MATPNLLIQHIAQNQNQKEVTANTAFDDLDLAMTQYILEDIPDAHFLLPLTDAQQNMVFIFAGVISQTRGITLPLRRLYIVSVQTFSSPAIPLIFGTASSPSGRIVTLSTMLPGQYAILYCDGVNVDLVAESASLSAAIGGWLRKTTSYVAQPGDNGQLITFDSTLPVTYTLSSLPFSQNWFVFVKNVNTGPVTINPSGASIDNRGAASLTLYQGDFVLIATNGLNYATGGARPLSIGVFAPGTGTNGQILLYLPMDRAGVFPANAPNSLAKANTAATGSTVFSVKKNGVQFATITFAGSATSGTFVQASDASFVNGDVLEIDGPGTADASLANIGITLQGYRF